MEIYMCLEERGRKSASAMLQAYSGVFQLVSHEPFPTTAFNEMMRPVSSNIQLNWTIPSI